MIPREIKEAIRDAYGTESDEYLERALSTRYEPEDELARVFQSRGKIGYQKMLREDKK